MVSKTFKSATGYNSATHIKYQLRNESAIPAKDAHFQGERYNMVAVCSKEASPIGKTTSNASCIEGSHTATTLPGSGMEQ